MCLFDPTGRLHAMRSLWLRESQQRIQREFFGFPLPSSKIPNAVPEFTRKPSTADECQLLGETERRIAGWLAGEGTKIRKRTRTRSVRKTETDGDGRNNGKMMGGCAPSAQVPCPAVWRHTSLVIDVKPQSCAWVSRVHSGMEPTNDPFPA
jgi:hypothetical protein